MARSTVSKVANPRTEIQPWRCGRYRIDVRLDGGGGGVSQGKHYVYKESETDLANLWTAILKHSGCPIDQFADGSEPLSEMFG